MKNKPLIFLKFPVLLKNKKDASASEIKKAFRKLSLTVHPDKNSAPDAEIKFRQVLF